MEMAKEMRVIKIRFTTLKKNKVQKSSIYLLRIMMEYLIKDRLDYLLFLKYFSFSMECLRKEGGNFF